MAINAFDLIERVREHSPVAANALMDRLIPWLIPMAGGLGVRVREVNNTRCELAMPLKRRTRNHVGSMYIGAQMTLADLTLGVLLFRLFPPGPYGGLIKRVEADFIAKGEGDLRCVATLDTETAAAFDSVRDEPGAKAEGWLPVELIDPDGTVVTRMRALGALKRF